MANIHMIFGPQGPGKSTHALALARNQEQGATFAFEVTPMMFDFMENEFEPATQAELENCNVIGVTQP